MKENGFELESEADKMDWKKTSITKFLLREKSVRFS